MTRTTRMMMLGLALMIVLGYIPQGVLAETSESSFAPDSPYQIYERDEFTYQVSFRLTDGTELFVIRSKFRALYFYHDGNPAVKQHHMTASVGFYYGKTALGRPIIASITVEELAFYPKWKDSAGLEHDLVMDMPMFRLNESIFDGQRTGGMFMLDPDAVISYLPQFGGTFVLRGVVLTLDDGTELALSDEIIQIVLDKNNNDLYADNATFYGDGGLQFTSDGQVAILTADGSSPFIVVLDTILAYGLIGLIGISATLAVLHIKGRIRLPLGPLKRIAPSQAQTS